jgi:hypothetical protein
MKTILKALFLLIALAAVPVFAQSDFEVLKACVAAGYPGYMILYFSSKIKGFLSRCVEFG